MRRRVLSGPSKARAYYFLFRVKTAEGIQYRLAGFASASVGIFWALIEIVVYTVFYNYAANKEAGIPAGMTLQQAISYVWLAQAIWAMQPMSVDAEILKMINSGDVGIELCRPMDLYSHWFARTAATRLIPLFWRGSITILCGLLMPQAFGLALPTTFIGFCWSLVSLGCAFLLCTSFGALVATVRLSVKWGDGPMYMMMLIGGVLSGSYLPLQLWPESLQTFLLMQPFAGYLDIPIRLYIGSMQPGDAGGLVLMQLVWVALFVAAGKALMAKRLRTIIVQGG
jgi:ABC-2 type transport system permease protein